MNELTYADALIIANNYLEETNYDNFNISILENDTIEINDGWVFFFQSQDYLDTGNYIYLLAGNAPFLVNRFNKEVVPFGTAMNIEYYIREYEKGNLK